MKIKIKSTLITLFTLFAAFAFIGGISWGEMKHVPSEGVSKIENGIKATLKVTPSKNMVDLILKDAKTGKLVTEADVNAKIQLPNDSYVEKKLIGMKMGSVFSFMNSLDMSRKGTYYLEITVRAANKEIRFNFEHQLK
ncbi:MAG: hypothetical protein IT392_06950 [Nitrospirae bacterium]|nr:hypothetical protein [Nitrospirota bacterium]